MTIVDWRGDDERWGRDAELIAVADSGLYMLHGESSLLFYPMGSRAVVRARGIRGFSRVDLTRADSADLLALSRFARHPFGLDEQRLEALLNALGSDGLIVRDGRGTEGSASLAASAPTSGLEAFLQDVATASRRLEDVEVAIAEGYRKLGPDFPGMGEHWVHPGLVISGRLDPERPPVVAYTTVGSERRLLGFAYTRVLGPHDETPHGPFPKHAWHDHTGGVDEESLLLSGPVSMHGAGEGFRLAMVHVWTELANPAGPLAQNNWALPFHRAGLPVPDVVSSRAARALSLAGVGMPFYEQLLREGIGLRDAELESALACFEAGSRRAAAWLEARRGGARPSARQGLTAEDLDALETIWSDLWRSLEATVSPERYRDMGMMRTG